jgi:putative DNA primase/helicase
MMQDAALDYARYGWHVFAVAPNGKLPALPGRGHLDATTDEATIRAWWAIMPAANIGLSLDINGLVAVDIDSHKPDCEWPEFSQGISTPPTFTQRSPRGGHHLVFTAPPDAEYPGRLCRGVDIKHHGYILLAPSIFEGNPYVITDRTAPAPAPEWLPRRTDSTSPNPDLEAASLDDVRAALAVIPNDDAADWEWWSRVAGAVWNASGGTDEAFALFDNWSRRCSAYDESETRRKWREVSRSPYARVGMGTLFHLATQADPSWQRPSRVAAAFTVSGVAMEFPASPETVGLIASRGARLIRFNGDWLTRERGGFYRAIDEELIRREIRVVSQDGLTATKVNGILDELKAAVVIDAHGVELPHWLTDLPGMPRGANLIVCHNGILDPATGTLYQHSDELLTLNALPYDFDPSAPSPSLWFQFLADVFDGDEESISELQKMFGYFLTLDTSLQKIFAIIGPKRSGKGTIGRILESLIGKSNCCGPSFHNIGGDFGLQSFIGKQLAIIADARTGHRTDKVLVAERLLNISGEDSLDIGRKRIEVWHGRLNTRLLILSNELPALPDPSGALASRFVAFLTPNSFYGREDRALTDKLRCELPGIMNWAIEGLRLLRRDGVIVTPIMGRDLVDGIETLGSPVKAFVAERCMLNPDGETLKDGLWKAYREWHHSNGIPGASLSKEMFGRALKTAFSGTVKDYRPRVNDGDQRPRYWLGITMTGPGSSAQPGPPSATTPSAPPFGPGVVHDRSR